MKNKILNLLIASMLVSGSLFAQVSNSGPRSNTVNLTQLGIGGAIAVSHENGSGSGAGEGSPKFVDGNRGSKYLCNWPGDDGMWITYDTKTTDYTVDRYVIVSGNDAQDRDPKNWKVYGSNSASPSATNDADWTLLDTRDNETFPGRNLAREFRFSTPVNYRHYKMEISTNNGGGLFQCSEWEIYGAKMLVTLPETYGWEEAGSSFALTATVTAGTAPYAYEWTDSEGTVVSTTTSYTAALDESAVYNLHVSDAAGNEVTLSTTALVNVTNGETSDATFENLPLTSSESYWGGVDQVFSTFQQSGSYSFNNKAFVNDEGYGFAYSNLTGGAYVAADGDKNKFRASAGEGSAESDVYAIAKTDKGSAKITLMNSNAGAIISGVMVNNTAFVNNCIETGDVITTPFGEGDWMRVVFTGKTAGGLSRSESFYLADFRNEDPDLWYLNDSWRWVNLSSLEKIVELTVSIESSKSDLPRYVAIDDLGLDLASDEIVYEMTVNAQPWDPAKTYAVEPGANITEYSVTFTSSTHDIQALVDGKRVKFNSFKVDLSKPTVNMYKVQIISPETSYNETLNLVFEKKFDFDEIVEVLWNNTLMLNLRKLNEDGYYFSSYQWSKNGAAIDGANKPTYSVGAKATDKLDSGATYSVQMYAGNQKYFHTNEASVTLKAQSVKVYPNPATVGEVVTLEADVDKVYLDGATLEVYNLSGIMVAKQKVTGNTTALNLPSAAGTYIVKLKGAEGFGRELKVIVK